MPSSSSSPRRAERNVRLDPMGIYGTRSERRRQQLQRRRQYQNGVLWFLGIAGITFGAWWVFQPHPTLLRAGWSVPLPFAPATPMVVTDQGQAFLTSQSGGLWTLAAPSSSGVTKRIFSTAFPPGAPLLAGSQTLFWPGSDGMLRSIFLTGQQKWARALPSTLVTRPAVAHSKTRAIVAVGDDQGDVAAFDAASGAPLWQKQLGGSLGQGLAVVDGTAPAFICPTLAGVNSGGGLICLDAASGIPRWRFPNKAGDRSAGVAAPLVSQGKVYWCNDEGAVVALNANNGQKLWKVFAVPRVGSKVGDSEAQNFLMLRSAPTLVSSVNTLIVGGNDGLLRGFDTQSGSMKWSVDLSGPMLQPAQQIRFENADALLTSASSGGIFLIDPASGRVLRHWGTRQSTDLGVGSMDGTALALDSEGHLQGATLQ